MNALFSSAARFAAAFFLPFFFLFFSSKIVGQNGCPGCVIDLPISLSEDTVYLQKIPDGLQYALYDQNLSFRLPKTTTPVAATDTTVPTGLTISKIKILSVSGLPLGLDWSVSKTDFDLATETDGCVRICGTPLETDTFEVLVNIEATVFFIKQNTSFRRQMIVAPAVSTTTGFAMTNFTGCGAATVSFQNLVPSGGASGFSYAWNFGNGNTTTAENPPPQTFSQVGNFPVSFDAFIDTAGHNLLKIKVLALSCTDIGIPPIISVDPDLYLLVKNGADSVLFDSGLSVQNATMPHTFSLDLALEKGKNYTLEVWDEDSGLGGADDLCGAINFTTDAAGDTLKNGDLRSVLNIFHPVSAVHSSDTVFVFEKPAAPDLIIFPSEMSCAGDSIKLSATAQLVDYQWFMNGDKIQNTQDSIFSAKTDGSYFLTITTEKGCSATSETVDLSFSPPPLEPFFYVDQNVLYVTQPANLPAAYALFWSFQDSMLSNNLDFDVCAAASGLYKLEVEDLATGCRSASVLFVAIDSSFDCVLGVSQPEVLTKILTEKPFKIYPNPTAGELHFEAKSDWRGPAEIQVFTPDGVQLGHFQVPENSTSETFELETRGFSRGFFFLKIQRPDGRFWLEKMVLVR